MKVTGPGAIRPNQLRRAGRTEGAGGSFSVHLQPGDAAAAASAATPAVGIDGLLALQEVPDAMHGRKRVIGRAKSLLDRLDEIRHGLLLGRLSGARLQALARELRERRADVDDPRLLEILDEIELRAAVELAKLGR